MTSAFFFGAFVTAHFLMPRSSIHWIHSLSPFTMGRPLSTAQQRSRHITFLKPGQGLELTLLCRWSKSMAEKRTVSLIVGRKRSSMLRAGSAHCA